MKRIFDCTAVLAALFLFGIPMLLMALLVKLTSPGPVLYWSERVGVGNGLFRMPKFRTMRIETPAVATHLLSNPDAYLTPIGPFLRKTSLDELPQLWSVLKGDMSFVGPHTSIYERLAAFHDSDPPKTRYIKIWGNHDLYWQDNEEALRRLFPGYPKGSAE